MSDLRNMSLSKSVGDPKLGAANSDSDVKLVRGLLNVQIVYRNRSDNLLPVKGSFDSDLIRAIDEFQRKEGITRLGLVEPRSRTLDDLRKYSVSSHMRTSQKGIDFIKNQEVFRSHLYDHDGSTSGNTTIGYGYLVHRGRIREEDRQGQFANGISRDYAEKLLKDKLPGFESIVRSNVHVPLTQNQFDALCSLVYTSGDAIHNSKISELLNAGDYKGASDHFKDIHLSEGNPVPGLPARRDKESQLFCTR